MAGESVSLMAGSLGRAEADLLLKNARLVNVLSGEVHDADVAVAGGRVVGFGDHPAESVLDLKGAYLAPSLIDAHIHLESSMLTVPEFARASVPHGTGAVVTDPHEFANVAGIEGLRYVLERREGLPLDIFVTVPSCVPATPLETSGARMTSWDIRLLMGEPRVVALGEMMNWPGVIFGDPEVVKKLDAGRAKVLDGHAPGLSGMELDAYILAGPRSDHETVGLEEGREKLRRGMHIHLRQGSSEKNLLHLLPLVTSKNAMNFSFCTDDRHPASLIEEGHIDNNLRLAIKSGLDPVTAFQIGTISTAVFYGLKDAGAVAPGYFADFFTFDDIASPRAQKVFKRGVLVAEGGKSLFDAKDVDRSWMKGTMRVAPLDMDSFRIKAGGARIRVIVVVPGQIVTRAVVEDAVIAGGETVADVNRDLLKFAVIERHRASGRMGLGFVKGFGLKRGALASSVAHDSHNLGVLGTNDGDMLKAAETVISMGGGQALVAGGEVKAALPLPVAGLVSEKPLEVVAGEIRALHDAAAAAGCSIPDPFAVMSFLPLVPIPELRLTDMGLVDATKFQYTELFVK